MGNIYQWVGGFLNRRLWQLQRRLLLKGKAAAAMLTFRCSSLLLLSVFTYMCDNCRGFSDSIFGMAVVYGSLVMYDAQVLWHFIIVLFGYLLLRFAIRLLKENYLFSS